MENNLTTNQSLIEVIDLINRGETVHQLTWKTCQVTGIRSVTIMGLKVEVSTSTDSVFPQIYKASVRTQLSNWQYLGDGFGGIEDVKEEALKVVANNLRSLAHHVLSLSSFNQV